jgi:hypothetical protein
VNWVRAEDGYEVALTNAKVVARKAGGAPLKSLPKTVKDGETVAGLKQLQEWLVRHETGCRAEVEAWLVRSLPVPAAALVAVWPDPAWQGALRDLVTVPVSDGVWDLERAGLLRDADAQRGLGLVNLDGDSVWLTCEAVAFPHPVLLTDLNDLREFAADLGVDQGTRQLFREVWHRPATTAERAAAAAQYTGGRFAQLRHLVTRATGQGYPVRGGYSTCRIWEDGRAVTAAVWVGVGDLTEETETGDLTFSDAAGAAIPLAAVGPVAWSEGLRMAAFLYAGRVIDDEKAGP